MTNRLCQSCRHRFPSDELTEVGDSLLCGQCFQEAAYQERSADDFMLFTQGLTIPSATGPQLFKDCIADFQLECFRDLAPSLHAVRDGTMPPVRRFWIERTKKGAKDSDLAVCLLWLMAFPSRPFKGQICAANNKQARVAENRAVELLHYNPWLRDRVEIVQSVIRSKQAPREVWIHIESTGQAGQAHGEAPEFLWLNELVHVDKWAVMKAHMNNANGVPQGMVVVSTNAGVKGTEAEVWRKNAIADKKRWSAHILKGQAPWISKEDKEEARKLDPIGAEYARLWEGEWISGIGNAVTEAEINRCFTMEESLLKPEEGWVYVAGLDLGETHDHAGLAVLGANFEEQRIKAAYIKGWAPDLLNEKGVLEVDSRSVRRECLRVNELFGLQSLWYDPATGGRFMAQDLRRQGVVMKEMTFNSSVNQTAMAESFVLVVKDSKLECYEDEEGRLRRDFGKFSIVPKTPTGYKLTAVSDEFGHADVGTALVICLPEAVELIGGGWVRQHDVIWDENDNVPLTKEEVVDLPYPLREIYEGAIEDEEETRYSKRSRFKYPDSP